MPVPLRGRTSSFRERSLRPTERPTSQNVFSILHFQGPFETPQLTSEKKPAFGSGDEALAVPFVSVGFCQLLFGNRAALSRCKKHSPSRSLRKALFVVGGTKGSLFQKEQLPAQRGPLEALRFGVDVAAAASQSRARHPSLVPSPAPSLASRRLRDASAPAPQGGAPRVRVRICPKTFVAVPAPSGGVPRPGCSRFHTGAASASPADGRHVGGTRGSARC